ncbi:MAG: hypothetical protein O7C75_03060, partial [Verrucomicrobia bacterium]|nr:hypothetical protein [Verrucomicrobiota bacterium]
KISLKPASARNLVEGAVAYAKQFGFAPHRDYQKGKRVFGGISVDDFDQTFEYGQDGKPFFIQGPYETPQRVDQIIASLTRNCGEDNFHYLLEISE